MFDVARAALTFESKDAFREAYTQGELTDFSDHDTHRWGRALSPYKEEPNVDIPALRKDDALLFDLRLSHPRVHSIVMSDAPNVTVYRAIPADPETLIGRYSDHKRQILRRGNIPKGVVTDLNSSKYYEFCNAEIERLEALPPVDKTLKLKVGDYIAVERSYAVEHGESNIKGPFEIVTKSVPKKDIVWGETDFAEWAFSPKKVREFAGSLEELWDKARLPEVRALIEPEVVLPGRSTSKPTLAATRGLAK